MERENGKKWSMTTQMSVHKQVFTHTSAHQNIDMLQHAQISLPTTYSMLQAQAGTQIAPLVRLPQSGRSQPNAGFYDE